MSFNWKSRARWRARRLYAWTVRDKRRYSRYSWGWLNQLMETLFWENQGASTHPQYAWGALFAAAEARALGETEVSFLEFGVAGGRGLLALQDISEEVSKALNLRAQVYGFDTGTGLPFVSDLRDLPQLWRGGDFPMDFEALKGRLKGNTKLLIGTINATLPEFLNQPHARVGFISFDMDLYSSTVDALMLFRGETPIAHCLPRVACYMDDIMGVTFSDLTGERLAMTEYNAAQSPHRCISPVYGLRYHLGWPHNQAQWPEMMFWAHFLDHPHYGIYDGLAGPPDAPLD